MSEPVTIQLGLYGGCTEITDVHVVAAHIRVRADGTETFVAEHLRWNRGRQGPRLRLPKAEVPLVHHPSLFGGIEVSADLLALAGPDEPPEIQTEVHTEFAHPDQLTLFA